MRKTIILYEKNASQEYYQAFLEVAFKNPTTFFFLTMSTQSGKDIILRNFSDMDLERWLSGKSSAAVPEDWDLMSSTHKMAHSCL